MKINTRVFGEVEVADDKIIEFENGIIGFPDMKRFTLIHDEERGVGAGIRFLQSLDEPGFAMPVMDPLVVKEDYDPEVDDELLERLQKEANYSTSHIVQHYLTSDNGNERRIRRREREGDVLYSYSEANYLNTNERIKVDRVLTERQYKD